MALRRRALPIRILGRRSSSRIVHDALAVEDGRIHRGRRGLTDERFDGSSSDVVDDLHDDRLVDVAWVEYEHTCRGSVVRVRLPTPSVAVPSAVAKRYRDRGGRRARAAMTLTRATQSPSQTRVADLRSGGLRIVVQDRAGSRRPFNGRVRAGIAQADGKELVGLDKPIANHIDDDRLGRHLRAKGERALVGDVIEAGRGAVRRIARLGSEPDRHVVPVRPLQRDREPSPGDAVIAFRHADVIDGQAGRRREVRDERVVVAGSLRAGRIVTEHLGEVGVRAPEVDTAKRAGKVLSEQDVIELLRVAVEHERITLVGRNRGTGINEVRIDEIRAREEDRRRRRRQPGDRPD